jgi:hypothetical protein
MDFRFCDGWNPETEIRGFISILFEIVVGHPANDEADIPAEVPQFVSEMIKTGFLVKGESCLHSVIFLRL